MGQNVVELLVKDRDTAGPDLDALKAKLAELGATVETARADVDDADGAARLDDMRAKLARLNDQVSSPKIRLAGALRAEAQVHALEGSLDRLNLKEDEASVKTGRLSQIFGNLKSSLVPAFGEMSMGQKAMMGLNVATTFAEPLIAGLTVSTMGLVSSLAAAGGGLGIFAAVAKSAYSQVSTQISAYTTAQQAAQTATTAAAKSTALAQMKSAFNGLTASQKEFAHSIIDAHNEWNSFVAQATPGVESLVHQGLGLLPSLLSDIRPVLGPVESALHGIVGDLGKSLQSGGLKTMFTWIAQNAPQAITGLAHAIGNIGTGLGGMLRAFTPASHSVMSGLDEMTAKFAHWGETLGSHSGFQSLMQMFRTETPMAMGVLKNLGGVIKTIISDMTGLDGVGNSKTLLEIAEPFTSLLNVLLKANPALVRVGLYILAAASAGKKLKSAFGEGSAFSSLVNGAKGAFTALGNVKSGFSDAEAAASDATGIWGTLGGKLSTVTSMIREQGLASTIAAGATKVWTGIQAAFDAVMDANPIALVVIAVAALIAIIVLMVTHLKETEHIFDEVRHVAAEAFDAVRHAVAVAFDAVRSAIETAFDWIKSHWPLLLAILTGPIGVAALFILQHWRDIVNFTSQAWDDITGFIRRAWDDIVRGTETGVSTVLHWFERLPGEILNALADLGSMMFNAGVHAMESLIHGLGSMIGSIGSVMGSVASKIAGFIGLSPAKEGPLSGGGAPEIRGQHIGVDIARGISSQVSRVRASMAGLAHAAALQPGTAGALGLGGPAVAGAAGGPMQVTLLLGGNASAVALAKLLFEPLKAEVRTRGGGGTNSAQRAWGQNW